MSIQSLFRKSLTFTIAVAALSWGCGESSTTDGSNKEGSSETGEASPAQQTKRLTTIFRAAPSPMETARIIQKEGLPFNADYLCSLSLAEQDGMSSEHAIHLGLYGADVSYASIFQKNAEALKYLDAVKTLSKELGVGSILNDDVISRVEKNIANKDIIVTIVSSAFFELNQQLKDAGNSDLAGLIVAAGWVEGLYLATRELDGATDGLKQAIAEQKLILEDVIKLIDSYSDSDAIVSMKSQLQPVLKAFDGVKSGEDATPTVDNKEGVIVIRGGNELKADDETILAISEAIALVRNNLAKAS
jgi:hypothetical protein